MVTNNNQERTWFHNILAQYCNYDWRTWHQYKPNVLCNNFADVWNDVTTRPNWHTLQHNSSAIL